MRSPATHLAGNLTWTRHGTVWATWLVNGLSYGYRPTKAKQEIRLLHQALMRALPGESLWLGVRAGLDPVAVVERMLDGVDSDAHPEWAAECAATLDTLDQFDTGVRLYWLSLPLPNTGTSWWTSLGEPARSAVADMKDTIGLPRAGVSDKEVQRRHRQSDQIRKLIPHVFNPAAVTPAQMIWLQLHAQQRGLFADIDLPPTAGDDVDAAVTAPLCDPWLDEGGQTDLETGRLRRSFNPAERKFLKITQADLPGDPVVSYQSMLTVSALPKQGTPFPGGEFLGTIDSSEVDVDWALRMTNRSSPEALTKNRRALRNLNDQLYQRDDDFTMQTQTELDTTAEALAEYTAILTSDSLEVEIAGTVIYAVGGATAEVAVDQARSLASHLGDIATVQPMGYQEDLWWAMLPGVPTSRTVVDHAQIGPSRGWATAVPFASTDLGDAKGSLLALNITSGLPGVVLHDLEGSSARDVSGSGAVCAELGAGKSYLLKGLAGDVIDRGGVFITPDRTPMGEWAQWAQSVTAAAVADIEDPTYSLCPLRFFGRHIGSRVLHSFLTPLLNVAPTSPEGVLLSDVLEPDYLATHDIDSTGELLAHLISGCEYPGAAELGRVMGVFSKRDFGRIIFDQTLPSLPDGWRALVVRTHTLALPSANQLTSEHLFKQMRLEQVFGRAMYALIAAMARRICFTNVDETAMFVVDEAYHVTLSPESEEELVVFIRDGRKHNAAVWLGSHDAATDFGSQTLRGLIPTRLLLRHRDKTLAGRGLEWLGLDPTDEALLDLLMNHTSPVGPNGVDEPRRGEGFMRDASNRIGRIKVLGPSLAARNAASRTTPGQAVTRVS